MQQHKWFKHRVRGCKELSYFKVINIGTAVFSFFSQISLKAPQLLQQLGLEDNAEVFAFVVPELDFHVIGEQVLASSS